MCPQSYNIDLVRDFSLLAWFYFSCFHLRYWSSANGVFVHVLRTRNATSVEKMDVALINSDDAHCFSNIPFIEQQFYYKRIKSVEQGVEGAKHGSNTKHSQTVTHSSTILAQRCLTSVFRREPVLSTWYGRYRW